MNIRKRALRILQVSTSDLAGGAERSATNLHEAFRKLGAESWLAVGMKRGIDPDVFMIRNECNRNSWVRGLSRLRADNDSWVRRVRGLGRLIALLQGIGEPIRWMNGQLGIEDFAFPGTKGLLDLVPHRPDIVHCHNLHGNYFDLRELPRLSSSVPTILNLRDAWLLSGHCAFSFDCQRWKHGCGKCPDLGIFPSVRRDATAYNWQRKKNILRESRVYVTTPSQWLMDRVRDSIVAPAIIDSRVIPNGVDTSVFSPGDKVATRAELGIPSAARVLLFAANGIRSNIWKDYKTLSNAMRIVGAQHGSESFLLLALGETAPPEYIGNAMIKFVPFQSDLTSLAKFYRAADLYVHAAHVESFGNTVIEARACGTPVVATAVGGIPEHVRSLACDYSAHGVQEHSLAVATGILTAPGNAEALAHSILYLFAMPEVLNKLAANALKDIHERFSLSLQAEHFLAWYGEILANEIRFPPNRGS